MTDAERARVDALESALLETRLDADWERRARARLSRRNRALIAFAVLVLLLAVLAR